MMLLYFALLICSLQWALAAPTFPEAHYFAIDEAGCEGVSCRTVKTIEPEAEPMLYKRIVAPSRAFFDDIIGQFTGKKPKPAASPAASPTPARTNSTGTTAQQQPQSSQNGTLTSISSNSTLLSNSTSSPATLAKRRMAIPKIISPFENSKMVVETRRRQD